jgi:hypothetical protein
MRGIWLLVLVLIMMIVISTPAFAENTNNPLAGGVGINDIITIVLMGLGLVAGSFLTKIIKTLKKLAALIHAVWEAALDHKITEAEWKNILSKLNALLVIWKKN